MAPFQSTLVQTHRRFITRALSLAALLAVSALAAHGRTDKPDALRIGTSGPLCSEKDVLKERGVLAALQLFIKNETGINDEITQQKGWAELADRLVNGELQVGVFQGYEFAWAQEKHPNLKPLALAVSAARDPAACVVVRRDSEAPDFAALEGQSLCLPDNGQGYLRLFLDRECRARGKAPKAYFSKISSQQNVEDCLDEVVDGAVQGAVLEHAVLEAYKRRKPARFDQLKVVCRSRPLPPVVVAYCDKGLDEAAVKRFREGLVGARDREKGRTMLTLFQLTCFEAAPDNFEKVLAETRKAYPPPKAELK
jgi:ABC-type phosphate/phosphonate transport system substrate-binding protein